LFISFAAEGKYKIKLLNKCVEKKTASQPPAGTGLVPGIENKKAIHRGEWLI
jgi:hypothetical protein